MIHSVGETTLATATQSGLLDGLPFSLPDVGVVSLMLIFVWLLVRGQIVTKREHDALTKERDYWRDAFFKEQSNTQALMETGRVAQEVFRALPVPQQGEASET